MSDSVGVWLTNTLSKRAPQGASTARTAAEPLSSSVFYGSTSLVQKALVPVLEQECLAVWIISLSKPCVFHPRILQLPGV
jgi:hypothetical protein